MRIILVFGAGMYICICNAVSDRAIRTCIDDGARTLAELGRRLGVGSGCGCCVEAALALLDDAAPTCGEVSPNPAAAAA